MIVLSGIFLSVLSITFMFVLWTGIEAFINRHDPILIQKARRRF